MSKPELLEYLTIGGHQFPGIWKYMLPSEVSDLWLPSERLSSCSNCPNVCYSGYKKQVKCCTYHPKIPNFSLGFALELSERKDLVESLILKGFTTPEGSQCSPYYWKAAVVTNAEDLWGRNDRIKCKFVGEKDGSCQIYPFRNAICSTFFCQNNHGDSGFKFWELVQGFVTQVETAISQWALEQVGFSIPELMACFDLLAQDLESASDKETNAWSLGARKILFGDWYGKELELYRACADVVYKNLHDLYDISLEVKLADSQAFENALVQSISEVHQEEIDSDYHVQGEPAQIEDLWYAVKLGNRNLWKIPIDGQKIELNSIVCLEKNPKDNPRSQFYKDCEFRIVVKEDSNQKPQYLTAVEADALELFRSAIKIDGALFEKLERVGVESPQEFLSENLAKKILVEESLVGYQ